MATIDNMQDILDSRDIIKRLAELEEERKDLAEAIDSAQERLDEASEAYPDETNDDLHDAVAEARRELKEWDDDNEDEVRVLRALCEEGEGATSEWHNGATLIHEDYFVKYAEQYASDIGAISGDLQWPLMHINWDEAADDLRSDFTEIDFDGVTYLTLSC